MLGRKLNQSARFLLMVALILNKCLGSETYNPAAEPSTSGMKSSSPQPIDISSDDLPAGVSVSDFIPTVQHAATVTNLTSTATTAKSTTFPQHATISTSGFHYPGENGTNDIDQAALEQDYEASQCKFNWYSNRIHCECFRSCPSTQNDSRQLACGRNNVTYESDCHLYNRRCQCNEDTTSCADSAAANDTLDYYGQCTELGACPDLQYEQFPERISNWIKNSVCEWMNSRNSSGKDPNVARASFPTAAAFVFCLTDVNRDSIWQHDEMTYLLATFKVLEPCFQRYLQECDTNNDGALDVMEWATCLKMDDSQLSGVDCNV